MNMCISTSYTSLLHGWALEAVFAAVGDIYTVSQKTSHR